MIGNVHLWLSSSTALLNIPTYIRASSDKEVTMRSFLFTTILITLLVVGIIGFQEIVKTR
jgi:heme/copper-type cytochrome/quinol oxidase subunit 4